MTEKERSELILKKKEDREMAKVEKYENKLKYSYAFGAFLRELYREGYEDGYKRGVVEGYKTEKNANETDMGDYVSRKRVIKELNAKGQSSTRYEVGESWELNAKEIREALENVPSIKLVIKEGGE